ncbi:DNA-binding transcriptional regulator, MarR family [Alteribacillus persepolensis]|uniref:DNA-binding transcriptional regulator, MarR family n=1 Tax=Alteribacillus persepolensis TaxID=568899 RepID=A0A1G8JQW8_9BACI|nr:MarR family transcriptional regulator [Alteribacillus persepolensis]SDI33586.1 DNA-binding transcriptional regulator, MarR family [Alteribacillus persepolensis]
MNKEALLRAVDDALFDVTLKINEEFGAHYIQLSEKYRMVLFLLSKHSSVYVKDIVRHLHASPSAVSQLLSKMEAEQYIIRTLDPNQRRQTFVRLGKRGTDVVKQMKETRNRIASGYLMKLPYDDIETLYRITEKLRVMVSDDNDQEISDSQRQENCIT